VVSDEV
jgi:hypothetical protein